MSIRSLVPAIAVLQFMATAGYAQSLGIIPGQTTLERRVGTAINQVCAPLNAAGVSRFNETPLSDLFARCQDLVQTGNAINDLDAPTTWDLGLSASQTNAAIVWNAHEEFALSGVDA